VIAAGHAGRGWVAGVTVAALAAITGCTVGSGSGSATGSLWVAGCNNGSDLGTQAAPVAYALEPTFFAGEPLDDLSQGPNYKNRLIVRMQHTGLALQYNDTLYFDVENSYEVARCVRGRTVNGQPDWKMFEPNYDNTKLIDWCDWSARAFSDGGADAGGTADAASDAGPLDAGASFDGGMSVMAQYPKIHITTDTDLRSSLALLTTCPQANVSADATDGWVEFMDFGSAGQPDLAPELRTAVPPDFVISFGGRLRATFHLVLQDARVVVATETNLPAPAPEIGATLDGYIDFELDRGRAAQAFP
jgi:hypothetical protein